MHRSRLEINNDMESNATIVKRAWPRKLRRFPKWSGSWSDLESKLLNCRLELNAGRQMKIKEAIQIELQVATRQRSNPMKALCKTEGSNRNETNGKFAILICYRILRVSSGPLLQLCTLEPITWSLTTFSQVSCSRLERDVESHTYFSFAFFPSHFSMPACLAVPLRQAPSHDRSGKRVPWGCTTWQSHKEEDSMHDVTERRF